MEDNSHDRSNWSCWFHARYSSLILPTSSSYVFTYFYGRSTSSSMNFSNSCPQMAARVCYQEVFLIQFDGDWVMVGYEASSLRHYKKTWARRRSIRRYAWVVPVFHVLPIVWHWCHERKRVKIEIERNSNWITCEIIGNLLLITDTRLYRVWYTVQLWYTIQITVNSDTTNTLNATSKIHILLWVHIIKIFEINVTFL